MLDTADETPKDRPVPDAFWVPEGAVEVASHSMQILHCQDPWSLTGLRA